MPKSIFNLKEKANLRSKLWYQANKHRPEYIEAQKERIFKWRSLNPERYLLQHAKARAKDRNVVFDLKLEDIKIPKECPVLRRPFEFGTRYSMSVDRINPKLGYTKDNIQVISWKANMMKQDASLEELRNFAQWASTFQR